MAEDTSVTYAKGQVVDTTIKSSIVRENALYTGQLAPFLGKQYSIFLLNTNTNKVSTDFRFLGLNPLEPEGVPEFFFDIAPKVYEMGEPFASNVVATQRGGKFVEANGSILKNIMIRGTTGLRPRRSRGKFSNIPIVGEDINSIVSQSFGFKDLIKNTPTGEPTGFDDIIFLQNIFRAYSDCKENDAASNNTVMVWRNNKDNDSWIVEPKDFKINRNSTSPLTYEYNIVFQTLAPLTVALRGDVSDPLEAVLAVRKVFQRVKEFNQSLRRTFLIVSTNIRRLEGLGVYAQTALLDPIISVIGGLGIIRYTGATFGRRLKHNAQVLGKELDDAIDLLSGTPGVEPQDALVRSLRRARITVSRILVEPGVRESAGSESSGRKERFTSAYISGGDLESQPLVAPTTGGSQTYLGNVKTTNALAQGTVNVGENIRSIAGRLMGDKSAWQILAVVNGLSAPYITPTGEGDTLAYGEPILYPSTSGAYSGDIRPSKIEDSESGETGTPIKNVYGRDLRLRSVPAGLTELADLRVNQRGDLSTVTGTDNVYQSLVVKFSTEKGELPVHYLYGGRFPVGSKHSLNAVNDFRTQVETTLLSDRRIQKLKTLNLSANGDIIVVRSDLVLLDSTDSLSLSIPVRRI